MNLIMLAKLDQVLLRLEDSYVVVTKGLDPASAFPTFPTAEGRIENLQSFTIQGGAQMMRQP